MRLTISRDPTLSNIFVLGFFPLDDKTSFSTDHLVTMSIFEGIKIEKD